MSPTLARALHGTTRFTNMEIRQWARVRHLLRPDDGPVTYAFARDDRGNRGVLYLTTQRLIWDVQVFKNAPPFDELMLRVAAGIVRGGDRARRELRIMIKLEDAMISLPFTKAAGVTRGQFEDFIDLTAHFYGSVRSHMAGPPPTWKRGVPDEPSTP